MTNTAMSSRDLPIATLIPQGNNSARNTKGRKSLAGHRRSVLNRAAPPLPMIRTGSKGIGAGPDAADDVGSKYYEESYGPTDEKSNAASSNSESDNVYYGSVPNLSDLLKRM
jgi:hypothetical protein